MNGKYYTILSRSLRFLPLLLYTLTLIIIQGNSVIHDYTTLESRKKSSSLNGRAIKREGGQALMTRPLREELFLRFTVCSLLLVFCLVDNYTGGRNKSIRSVHISCFILFYYMFCLFYSFILFFCIFCLQYSILKVVFGETPRFR